MEPSSDPDPILATLNTVECSNNQRPFSGPREPHWVAPPFPPLCEYPLVALHIALRFLWTFLIKVLL